MMAAFAADGAVLPVKEYALAYVDLHVTLRRLGVLTGAVAKGALRICQFDNALSGTDRALFCLHHIRYRE